MYYLVTYEYTPYMCRSIIDNIVISEEVSSFIKRNKDYIKNTIHAEGNKFIVLQWKEISKEEYDSLKNYNPTSEYYVEVSNEDRRITNQN